MTPMILFLGAAEGFEAARAALGERADLRYVRPEAEAVAAALTGAQALLDASMKVRITDAMVNAAPDLRVISCATTGANHIERGALEARGIPVMTLREDPEVLRNLTPAAELSWALLMACARRLPAAAAHVTRGLWVREDFPGIMLNGRTLGLVGCGRIGQWMARYATAFGMTVVGHDPHLETFPPSIRRVPLDDVFRQAHFISVHVHLTPETDGLVSAARLRLTQPGTILINTSRGQVIDETALLALLRSGHLGGAGLDVLSSEPDIAADPLVEYAGTHDNLIITPHCGGFSPDAVRIVCAHAARKIAGVLRLAQ